jgi:serine carboxypeptidase-like clade 4
MYAFTLGFYKQFPSLLRNKLFVTGESYGGHYVSAISSYIVAQNQKGGNVKIPFAGCAIGNGLVNPLLQYPQYAPFAYSYGLISKFDVQKYAVEMAPCKAAIEAGLYTVAYEACNIVMQGIKFAAGIANVYNVKAKCAVPPLCYDFSAATTLLNEPTVQAALNVPHGITWESCNFDVNM